VVCHTFLYTRGKCLFLGDNVLLRDVGPYGIIFTNVSFLQPLL
jgi:hypothetical protein